MSNFTIKVIGAKAILDRFRRAAQNIKSDTSKNLLKAAALIQRTAKRKVSGPVLKVRTGQLRRGILIKKSGSGVGTIVRVGPTVKYGAIHEFGGKTKPHVIKVRNMKALRFEFRGQTTFARQVNHPGSKIPERPYMRPSLQENLDAVTRLIGRAFKPIVT